MNKNNQTSGCPSRSEQHVIGVSSQQEKTEQFVELVLHFQKSLSSISSSEEPREAVEEVLSESFPDDVVEAMMCLLKDADKQTIQRFARNQLFHEEASPKTNIPGVKKETFIVHPSDVFIKFHGTTSEYTLTNVSNVWHEAYSWNGKMLLCKDDQLMEVATNGNTLQNAGLGLHLAPELGDSFLKKHRELQSHICYLIQEHVKGLQYYLDLHPYLDNGLWGFRNPEGLCVLPARWKDASPFTEGLAAVCDEQGRYGYINLSGEIAIPCRFSYAWPFINGLAIAENRNGHQGFINHEGRWAIPPLWDRVEPFAGRHAAVMDENGKWGYIFPNGRLAIPCEWAKAEPFGGGSACVTDFEGRSYLIGFYGNIEKRLDDSP